GVGAVEDRPVDGLAGQELDAAGGEDEAGRAVGAAVEVDPAGVVEREPEVLDADPDVVEVEQAEEVDPAGRSEVQRPLAEEEAVVVDRQARNRGTARRR